MENQPTLLLTRSSSRYDRPALLSLGTHSSNGMSRCCPTGTTSPPGRGKVSRSRVDAGGLFNRAPRLTPPTARSDGSHTAVPVLVARISPDTTSLPASSHVPTCRSVISSVHPRSEGSRPSGSTSARFLSTNIRRLRCELRR